MKTPTHWKSTFLTALLTLLTAGASLAQQMNYQGRLTDSSGNAVPDAQYSIIFNIFDSATGGTNKWGPQTIPADVVQGRFNVILGPTDTASRSIVSAFDGGTRYLQITYQGNPILPRQQILSAPTAFFSQNAGQLANVYVNNGNVGIGTTNPGALLSLGNTLGNTKLALWDFNATFFYGLGIQGGQFRLHTSGAGDRFSFLNAPDGTENMTILGNGNVGIGTAQPGAKLELSSTVQLSERLRLSGQEFYNAGNTSSAGISFLLGVNRGGNRQLWIADSARLAQNTSNPTIRITPGGGIDAVATDGLTTLPLQLGGAGNVGIGTTPAAGFKLDVNVGTGDIRVNGNGNSGAGVFLDNTEGSSRSWYLAANGTDTVAPSKGFFIRDITANQTRLTISTTGNVGIGTLNPTRAKLEISGSVSTSNNNIGAYFDRNAAHSFSGGDPNQNAAYNLSLYCTNNIVCDTFMAFGSDARMKNIQGRSDGAADLATLTRIEITDYTLKDVIAKGNAPHKRVIAQQVEKVYPQVVSRTTNVVPDIYQESTVRDGWVTLATDLKVGERVRLIGEKEEAIHAVLEVREGAFRTAFQPATDAVFVYGREVKDFRTVDYEAIAMLNVSATQELARKLAAQSAECTQLRAELTKLRAEKHALAQEVAALTARDQTREARLTRLESALAAARTVSASLK